MGMIARSSDDGKIVVGVDTHKHLHVAVALDALGGRRGQLTISADSAGYAALAGSARALARVVSFGVEGTGSYGSGLAAYLRRAGYLVVEVNRGDRRARRGNGKSDDLDAEAAARAVLNGAARAIPKSADGACEMIRQVKIARDTAVKARTQAIITLKYIVVNTPPELREQLATMADKALIDHCARFRSGTLDTTTTSAKHALRALARRWLALASEIKSHDAILNELTTRVAPTLRDRPRHRSRDADRVWRQPRTHPLRRRLRQALRHRTDTRLVRHDNTPPPLARRPPTGKRRALPRNHRPHAIPPTND